MTIQLISKRRLLRGMFAMPAIVMIDNIMPIKVAAEPRNFIVASYKGIVFQDAALYYAPYIPWFAPAGFPTLKNTASVVQW